MSHFIDFSILHLSLSSIVRFPPSSYHVPPKEKVESVSFSDPRDFTKDFRVIRPVIIKGIHCQEMLWMPYKIPL